MPTALGTVAAHRTAAAPPIPATGLAAWWDATDPSTFTYSAGVTVSQWADKSGASRLLVPVAAPTRDATINGVTAVRFNGNQMLCGAFAAAFTTAELFAVFQNVAETGGGTLGYWSSSGTAQHYPFVDGQIYEPWGSTVRHILGNPTPDLLLPHAYNVRTADGSYVAEVNGGALYTSATNTVGFAAGSYYIGDGGAGAGTFNMGELIVYSRVLNGTERGTVESYLGTKWGITFT